MGWADMFVKSEILNIVGFATTCDLSHSLLCRVVVVYSALKTLNYSELAVHTENRQEARFDP